LKCSVCAKNIPENRYSAHLESEHGVTDDPTAVLIQHLSGLGSRADEDGADDLPDEEPSDADAVDQPVADHRDKSDEEEAAQKQPEPAAEEPEPERERKSKAAKAAKAAAAAGAAGAGGAPPSADGDDDTGEDAEDELTDKDDAEFERMLAAYPDVDLRKGRPKTSADPADTAAVAGAGAVGAPADRDEKTFAVWDEARGAAAADDDLLVVVPPAERERARRRRGAALLVLGAAIILIAVAVIYLLTRDTGTKKTTAVAPVTLPPTTVAPTFLPGPAGGAATTVPATTPATQPPVSTAPASPATTAAPPTTAAPGDDPAGKIAFTYIDAVCTGGQLSVRGGATNNNAQTYSFTFTVEIVNASGVELGRGSGSISHLPPNGKAGFVATGQCTNITGGHPQQQINSITPG
jgi:type IV secretory pathway VirB10-like protein